ncbi:hypothetical protein LSH36_231g00000 [Paralvinella palmiformis]|uniref:Uncharacterized protein n=1 Tax=Paralvinella palmiformis TaxID=53620 RepID=A0AAD9N543_9ANNE|nr:hypothetical protein LSH36_231g00000 [Paralvinella palmiformis]
MADFPEDKENSVNVDIQFCGDNEDDTDDESEDAGDDEVFFGHVTKKELRKAAKYQNRRTVVFQANRNHQIMRHDVDTLSMMSLNQQHLEDGHSSDQPECIGGSLPSAHCPLLSENKTAPLAAQRPLVVNLLTKAFGMLMTRRNPNPSTNGLCREVTGDLEVNDGAVMKNLKDVVFSKEADSQHSKASLEKSESVAGQSEYIIANHSQSDEHDHLPQSSTHLCHSSLDGIRSVSAQSQIVSDSVDLVARIKDQNGITNMDTLVHATDCSSDSGEIRNVSDMTQKECMADADVDDVTERLAPNVSRHCPDQSHLDRFSQSDVTNGVLSQSDRNVVDCDQLEADDEHDDEHNDELGRILDDVHHNAINIQNTDCSPLINCCANGNSSSPQVILGDINAMHGKILVNVFSQNSTNVRCPEVTVYNGVSGPDLGLSHPALSDNEQEVPYMKTAVSHEIGIPIFESDTSTHHQDVSGLGDCSVVVVDDSSVSSSGTEVNSYSVQSDGSLQCHLVPDIAITPEHPKTDHSQTGVTIRRGVIFKERQFSPMLTVIASPDHSNETSPTDASTSENPEFPHVNNSSHLGLLPVLVADGDQCQVSLTDSQPQCSPLAVTDVKFTFVKESPRKTKLKRLNPGKTTSSDHSHLNSVFERLYRVNKAVELQSGNEHRKQIETPKGTPVMHRSSSRKVVSSPRLNVASKLRISAGMKGAPRKALTFESDHQQTSKRSGSSVRTSGNTDQCNLTKTNIRRKVDVTPKNNSKMSHCSTPQSNCKLKCVGTPQDICKSIHQTAPQDISKVRHPSTTQDISKVRHQFTPQDICKVRHRSTPKDNSKSRHTPRSDCPTPQDVTKYSRCIEQKNNTRVRHYSVPEDSVSKITTIHNSQQGNARSLSKSTQQWQLHAAAGSPSVKLDTTPRRQSPALSVYRKGTPRYCSGPRHRVNTEQPAKLNLDQSDTEACDLSLLDESIILQEKKVELERVQAEKFRLERKLTEQNQNMKLSAGHHQRSALRLTTSENTPRMRFNDTYTLKLSEPELDAITLVHTLCNSQQIVKRVTKAHATAVIGQTYVPKEASRLQWHEDLVTDVEDVPGRKSNISGKSILHLRSPGFVYPFSDQPPSNVVVVKSTKRFLAYGKEASPLMSKLME